MEVPPKETLKPCQAAIRSLTAAERKFYTYYEDQVNRLDGIKESILKEEMSTEQKKIKLNLVADELDKSYNDFLSLLKSESKRLENQSQSVERKYKNLLKHRKYLMDHLDLQEDSKILEKMVILKNKLDYRENQLDSFRELLRNPEQLRYVVARLEQFDQEEDCIGEE